MDRQYIEEDNRIMAIQDMYYENNQSVRYYETYLEGEE